MKKSILTALAALAVVTTLAPAAADARVRKPSRVVVEHHHTGPYETRSELLVEAGAAMPLGDLGDEWTSSHGLEAGTGWDLGVRYRYALSDHLVVSPAFHYRNFGNLLTEDDQGYGTEVATSAYRYGVDLQFFLGAPEDLVRPYFSLGPALYHNRYWDYLEGEGSFESSSSNLGAAAGAGLVMGPIELSASYELDRTESRSLPSAPDDTDRDYDWDHVIVRAGFSLSRF